MGGRVQQFGVGIIVYTQGSDSQDFYEENSTFLLLPIPNSTSTNTVIYTC